MMGQKALQRVVLCTGGTGGHIFPALAVAEALQQRHEGVEILFVGSLYGPEAELASKAGLSFVGLPVRGFLGRGLHAVGAAWGMMKALIMAVSIMKRFKPQVVAGFGGYAAFAPVTAAWLCGIPVAVHEQNAVAGMSNKLLARLALRVFTSMPETVGFDAHKCVLTGNPVRASVTAMAENVHDFSGKRLLVVGGSLGARALNDFVLAHGAQFRLAGVSVRHQTGARDYERVVAASAQNPPLETASALREECTPFIADMAEAYAWADLVLCRSGASTVAELAVAGRGAIFVPFPFATHDHQAYNARLLEKEGAALLVPEKHLKDEEVLANILKLLGDAQSLQGMGAKAKAAAKPDAAQKLADGLAELVGASRHTL